MSDNAQDYIKDKEALKTIAGTQQGKAADPQYSVWVEASAGTGKTKVLSDRVIRLLLSGVNPAKILCLTYTKAAAVEMNTRISERLGKWAVISDKELNKELENLLGKIEDENKFAEIAARARTLFATMLDVAGGMKIQTIHSFCQEILKRFPLEAGISPYFSVMDDSMAKEALDEVCNRLILNVEQCPDTPQGRAIAYLTSHITEFKFPELLKALAENRNRLIKVLENSHGINNFLQKLRQSLGFRSEAEIAPDENVFVAAIPWDEIRKITAALAQSTITDNKTAEKLQSVITHFDYELYKSAFLGKDGGIKSKLACKDAVNIYPEIVERMTELALSLQNFEDYKAKAELYYSTKAVMLIAADLANGYQTYKRRNARLDYEDLIVITSELLQKSNVAEWVLFKLDGGISHVLIDEAQDTSPNQWSIIKAVTDEFFAGSGQADNNRTVFAVGDRKQSIYSFQGADPAEFERMRQHFASKSRNFCNINLSVSFRSVSAVLETVNHLFSIEEAKSGVVLDNQEVKHLPFRIGEAGKVELWPLEEGDEEDKDNDAFQLPTQRQTRRSASSKLAKTIAEKIKSMVEGHEILESKHRPLCYGDFMVLVQRRNSFVEDFVKACKSAKVNICGADKLKLLAQIAVQDLISLGRFLLLPEDDLSLAEVLKSPLFGLNDDDLFTLCYNRGQVSLWYKLKNNPSYAAATRILTDLLNKTDYCRPFELFNYVLGPLKGRQKFVARLGTEAEDAIDEFINLTLSFEEEHVPDLQSFINLIVADNTTVKRELDQPDNDAVRIMTVHGSKGLQAPVVILPDTTRVVNAKREAKLLWGDDNLVYYPLGADFYDRKCQKIHEADTEKAFDEYRRLLYVALTRAEDRLYICGWKNSKSDEKSWYSLCQKAFAGYGIAEDNGNLVYKCEQQSEPTEPKSDKTMIVPELEEHEWLDKPAPEETPLSRPYTPSRPDDNDDTPAVSPLKEGGDYFRRGILIHKLLQFLPPQTDVMEKARLIDMFLAKSAPEMSADFRAEIKNEVLTLFNDEKFNFIFSGDSRAEVPVMGVVNGKDIGADFESKIISAQFDRLTVLPDKVIIVDFKTNREPAASPQDIPDNYKKQLQVYKHLAEKIYPDKNVETYILWTNTAKLMPIV